MRVGRFEVLEEIARGGMGVVYRALDPDTRRVVAVKLMLQLDSEVLRKRFQREAGALSRVQHPGVVGFHEQGLTEAGVPYLAMEVVGGDSLQTVLDRSGPPTAR